jgi:hypothetical protein
MWLRWMRWWFSCLQQLRQLLSSSKSLSSAACYDTRDLLDLLVIIFWPICNHALTFTCLVLCFLQVNYLFWLFTCRGS